MKNGSEILSPTFHVINEVRSFPNSRSNNGSTDVTILDDVTLSSLDSSSSYNTRAPNNTPDDTPKDESEISGKPSNLCKVGRIVFLALISVILVTPFLLVILSAVGEAKDNNKIYEELLEKAKELEKERCNGLWDCLIKFF